MSWKDKYPDEHPPVTSCGCIGPQNGQPLCPCRMKGLMIIDGRWVDRPRDYGPAKQPASLGWPPKPKGGFEDVPVQHLCRDAEHSPPTMIVIPAGKRYRHVCPTCGAQAFIYGASITC